VSRPRSPSSGVDDGEVSPFLVDVTDAETSFEVRGPFGGSFVWEPTDDSLLLAGLRPCGPCGGPHAVDPVTVLYSARAAERIIYAEELAAADFDVEIFLTRDEHPDHRHGQFDAAAHTDQGESRSPAAAFVCGPTAFVETVANALADTVLDPLPDPHRAIRTRVPALPPAR
jgi:NAD(P)H-flavin reductase